MHTELNAILAQIETSRQICIAERDILRGIQDALDEAVENMTLGVSELEEAKQALESAIDTLGEQF